MEATIDSGGRLLLPKSVRDSLGLVPGSKVDISIYGDGLHITPGGRTARVARDADGRLVAHGKTVVTDDTMFSLMESGRR